MVLRVDSASVLKNMSYLTEVCTLLKSLAFLTLIHGCLCETWQTRNRETDWTFSLAQKSINQTIVTAVSKQDTVHSCAFWCSFKLAELVVSFYYDQKKDQCHCNKKLDKEPDDLGEDWIYYGQLKDLFEIEVNTDTSHIRTTVWPYKSECVDLLNDGFVTDGIYSIVPFDLTRLFTVCDMSNGGWTVIQRRFDGSENFYRDWNDYRYGFGNRTGEYWLGLENVHRLTKYNSELHVYIEAFPGTDPPSMYAHYSKFSVGDHDSKFILYIDGYTGDCDDSYYLHFDPAFSTFDNDNDLSIHNCALYYETAGWLSKCYDVNLNGKYYKEGEQVEYATGIGWYRCWEYDYSVKSLVLKIRKV